MKPLSRSRFVLLGTVLTLLKLLGDFTLSRYWNQPWTPLAYWISPGPGLFSLGEPQRSFTIAMALLAVPFVCFGIWLCMRRLRTLNLPLWLVILFFFPAVNLVFFCYLAAQLAPIQRKDATSDSATGNRPVWQSILLPALAATAAIFLSIRFLPSYGWGIFFLIPFGIGLFCKLLSEAPFQKASWLSMSAIGLTGLFLLSIAVEGLICLLMAVPIAIPLTLLGVLTGGLILDQRTSNQPAHLALLGVILFGTCPLSAGLELAAATEPMVLPVTTTIEIDAPPSAVWPHVIQFPPLQPPTEWPFRLGIAYPIRARIEGTGPTAIRYCEFSTGPFVEPITRWQEPELLAFDVKNSPSPLEELSPYEIHPPHLDGFLTSVRGQFRLIPLDRGNRTRLEGTTWYRQRLYPEAYWRLYSDWLIHAIHTRVLQHIRDTTLN